MGMTGTPQTLNSERSRDRVIYFGAQRALYPSVCAAGTNGVVIIPPEIRAIMTALQVVVLTALALTPGTSPSMRSE